MFDCYDTLITPEEVADMLGCGMNTTYKLLKSGKIKAMRIYAKNGYITAYGIHADRFNVHIHFAVCAVSFQTQNMFHIQWKSEWNMLVTVTNQWKSEFDELLQNNIQMRQSREAALYGDDIVRYGSVPITAKGQMIQNGKSKRK